MITAPLLEADWAVRRLTGRGLRRDRFDAAAADPDQPATFATTVIRLPSSLAAGLYRSAAAVAASQPGHYVVPAESIHVTVCGPTGGSDERSLEVARNDLRELAPRLHDTQLSIVCLGIGDTSVFAGIEASGLELLAMRRELGLRWSVAGRGGLSGLLAGRLFWANLIRFSTPPSPDLMRAFGKHRRTRSAAFPIQAVELVRTNRAMSPDRTTVLARVPIAPSGARSPSPGACGVRRGSRSAASPRPWVPGAGLP